MSEHHTVPCRPSNCHWGFFDAALPPLLKKILADYSATGLPPAYLPQKPDSQKPQGETS